MLDEEVGDARGSEFNVIHKFNFVSTSPIKRTLASGLGEEGGVGKTGVQRKSSKGVVMS